MKGVDWGYGRVSGKTLKDNGYSFACRYLSHSPGKDLKPEEIDDLRANGIKIVVVFETTEQRALGGHDAGLEDARSARKELSDLGQIGPFGMTPVIYFACDWDFQESQMETIKEYFRGVNEGYRGKGVGVYGGYRVVSELFDAELVTYGWQTLAWSHDDWDDRAQLNQTKTLGLTLDGTDCDLNESTTDDFGQF